MTAELQLQEARDAWRSLKNAESELARLARYARLSAGMKDDRAKWSQIANTARATLARILGSTT